MSKWFNFAQAKGKWHKFPSFNLGGGAKLYKNLAQKLLAVSLCMAMVLLGAPRGQNFVAEAADEATKSVALLTLTATGGKDEPVTADMTWKRFIPGTTVDLQIHYVSKDGSLVSSVNFSDWFAICGSIPPGDPAWISPVPLSGWLPDSSWWARLSTARDFHGDGSHRTLFSLAGTDTVSDAAPLLSLCDVVAPLAFVVLGTAVVGFAFVPGFARLSVGGSVSAPLAVLFGDAVGPVSVTSSAPAVAVWEDGYIKGLSEGTATLTFMHGDTVMGTVEVAVGDWVPPHAVPAGLTAVAGTRLGDVVLPAPTDAGAWAWVHPDDLLTTPGTTTHKALYTPTDTENSGSALVDVPVEVYLEQTVTVKGKTQRLRVYDPNGVLPDGTLFEALAVTEHEHLDDDHEIEHLLAYDLSLLDASGNPLHMPLDAPVELCFEVLDGLDKDELEVVLVQEFDDAEFEENLVDLDGTSWVKVKTDHFSPYALIDKLSPEEKTALDRGNIQTGDLATQLTVSGLGMTLALALGIMLRLITNKRKFEE